MTYSNLKRNLVATSITFGLLALAQVPPTSIFQLDGNAASSNLSCTYGTPCDYWNLLNGTGNNVSGGGVGANSSAGHSRVRTFVNGTSSTFSFTGGGSKDPLAISQWKYSSGPTPNKDTINAAYAAAYQEGGHFELVFGADRLSPNGDANIGIWFFQQTVGPNGSGGFTGAHVDHDIFVVSAFVNGGGKSDITVYEWDHLCTSGVKNPGAGDCADNNLRVLGNASASNVCGTSIYCAVTNSGDTSSTWEGTIGTPLFFSGGVDLTAAFSAVGVTTLPCFSSFLVETRSSQSTSAVLKDFLAGGFPVCGLSISKKCGTPTVTSDGTSINYPVSGVVTNTGVGPLYNVKVYDTPTGGTAIARTVSNNTPGSPNSGTSTLGPGETGAWSDQTTSTATSVSDSAIAQGGLSASDVPDGTANKTNIVSTSTPATATCTSKFSTSLEISKSCSTSLSVVNSIVAVQVGYTGQVCNDGVSQVTGVVLTDVPSSGTSATITVGTLAPCTTFNTDGSCADMKASPRCATFSSSYQPTGIDLTIGGGTGAGRYSWSDLIKITAAKATVGTLSTLTTPTACVGTYGCATATCPLCGPNECTTQ